MQLGFTVRTFELGTEPGVLRDGEPHSAAWQALTAVATHWRTAS
ncbi:hypothetical protein [Streptomyces sp. CBMA152]|nr:hypothetical protein [Streptomyces sp. CBMA152]